MGKRRLQQRTGPLAWDDLRCVLTIARTGSLSGAARALGIEHSTVFRRLNGIEKRLGVKLFERTRSGYRPTASGETVAAAAGGMEAQALAIERHIVEGSERMAGVIRLATSELLAGFLLPGPLREFLKSHPGIEIELDVSNRAVDLMRREADVALRATNTPPDLLIGRQVGELRYAVYGVRGMAAAGAPLSALPWLGHDESIAHLNIAQWQRTQIRDAPPRVRFNSLAPMLQAAAEGLGSAALPVFAADRFQSLSRLTPVLDQPRTKLWVLCHKDMRENARVRALSQHLAKSLPHVLAARQSTA